MNLQIHNKAFPDDLSGTNYTNEFCVLNINVGQDQVIQDLVWNIVFCIDNSGSMTDKCKDERTKMDHIKHTITNCLRLFAQTTTHTFNVCSASFSEDVTELFDFTRVTSDNVDALISKIQCVFPTCSTNIVKPLQYARAKLNGAIRAGEKYIHILLTDGDDTCNNDAKKLIDTVCMDFKNIFIGFGKEHNSKVMERMCGGIINEYKYIDMLECAGLVYGEILHSMMYLVYENARIAVENGLIYDYMNNIWVNELDIGYLVADKPRSFHIRTTTRDIDDLKVNFMTTEHLAVLFGRDGFLSDQTKYIYRQRVLELLYVAKRAGGIEQVNETKKILKKMLADLKKKMEEIGATEDTFWKVMCDDIYVAILALGSDYAHMYLSARQTSQGRQNAYNVTVVEDDFGSMEFPDDTGVFHRLRLVRSRADGTIDEDYRRGPARRGRHRALNFDNLMNFPDGDLVYEKEEGGDDVDNATTVVEDYGDITFNYNMCSNVTSPYCTPSVSRVMNDTQNGV